MRVLVSGGAGFVGSHLCRRLLADGHSVTCVDNLCTGSQRNLEPMIDNDAFSFIEADVAKTPECEVDAIFHLASPASPVDYERMPLETLAANSLGTWRLLDIAASTGAHLTYVSTSEVYGDPLVHPQPESYWGNVDPVGPRSCYDEGKRFGEALVVSTRRARGVRACIVRVFNTYGPAMRLDDGRVIPEMLSAALTGRPLTIHGDGSQTRSLMYVTDLVEALVRVGLDRSSDGEILNIGNPEELTILDLASRILRLVNPGGAMRFVAAREGDPERRCPDISKISSRYGWTPVVELSQGLRLTTEWFRSELRESLAPAAAASVVPADSAAG